ncbi:MAG TPA: MFS transporter [Clostridia bacterium]
MAIGDIKTRIYSVCPALSHRNFRLFWTGQCVSLIGTWMQNIGQSWLVLQLTNSSFKLGLVSAMQFLPMMLFALFAGTLVDKLPKRTVLIFTQSSLAVLATILASLTFFNLIQYWHLLVLAALLGIVNTLDMPTRQSFFIELVGKEDLMNAIGLNSSIFNLARIIGPAVAGFLIALVGIGPCFYLNALSFLAVIVGLRMMDIQAPMVKTTVNKTVKSVIVDIRAGLTYIKSKTLIFYPLLLLAVISTFVFNFNVLVPIFAKQNLGQNAAGYGFMMTSIGIGSLIGALLITARSRTGPKLKYLLGGALGMCVFLAILGFEKNYALACVTLLILGFCSILFTTLVNSTIQLTAADNMRGRVMSVFSLVFGGVTPIGSLYTGKLTEVVGAPGCMIISGTIGILGTLFVMFWLKARQVKSGPAPYR